MNFAQEDVLVRLKSALYQPLRHKHRLRSLRNVYSLREKVEALSFVFYDRCKLNQKTCTAFAEKIVLEFLFFPCSYCNTPVEMCSSFAFIDYFDHKAGVKVESQWCSIMGENAINVSNVVAGVSMESMLLDSDLARHALAFDLNLTLFTMKKDQVGALEQVYLEQKAKGIEVLRQTPNHIWIACSNHCARARFRKWFDVMIKAVPELYGSYKKRRRNN